MGTLADAALAFALALAASPAVLWGLRRMRVLDVPTARSSHQAATPRGGGAAPALACVLAGVLSTRLSGSSRDATLVVSVCLGLIGLADDLRPRSALPRLLGQMVVALLALVWLLPGLGHGALVGTVAAGAMVLWLVGYPNVFNFMDGINGLAVAQVVVAGIAWWIIGSHQHVPTMAAAGLISAAAALAFAPFNVPTAKMFLGDTGSYFLGGWLGVTAVVGLRAGIAPEAVLAPLTLFLADAGFTLAQRVRRHQPWSQAHKEHAYQRLVQAGWSHANTSLALAVVMTAVSALGALSLTGKPALRAVGDLASLIVLAGYLALPTLLSATGAAPGPNATANP